MLAARLARDKAIAVAARHPGAVVGMDDGDEIPPPHLAARLDAADAVGFLRPQDGVVGEVHGPAANSGQALTRLRELSQPLGGILGTTGARNFDVSEGGGGLVRLTVTEPAIVDRVRQAVGQSIQIIERRVNELGTVEPLIQRQGLDRVLVQVPGLQDPTRLKDLLGKTAKLDFRMVDQSMTPQQAVQSRPSSDSEVLYSSGASKEPYLIEKRILVSGGDLTDAPRGTPVRRAVPSRAATPSA